MTEDEAWTYWEEKTPACGMCGDLFKLEEIIDRKHVCERYLMSVKQTLHKRNSVNF